MRYTMTMSAAMLLAANSAFAQDAMPQPADDNMQPMAAQPAQPQESIAQMSEGSGAIPPLPLEVKGYGDIKYVTGGVSDERLAELKSMGSDYNLQLLLATPSGGYISEAQLRILDTGGNEVLPMVQGVGPYFYAHLKPGKYQLEVTAKQGGIKTQNVTVPASGAVKPVMRFNEQ